MTKIAMPDLRRQVTELLGAGVRPKAIARALNYSEGYIRTLIWTWRHEGTRKPIKKDTQGLKKRGIKGARTCAQNLGAALAAAPEATPGNPPRPGAYSGAVGMTCLRCDPDQPTTTVTYLCGGCGRHWVRLVGESETAPD